MSVVLEVISLITLKNYGIFYVQVAFYGKNITDLKLYSFLNTVFLFVKISCGAPLNKKTLATYKMFILGGVQHNISIWIMKSFQLKLRLIYVNVWPWANIRS